MPEPGDRRVHDKGTRNGLHASPTGSTSLLKARRLQPVHPFLTCSSIPSNARKLFWQACTSVQALSFMVIRPPLFLRTKIRPPPLLGCPSVRRPRQSAYTPSRSVAGRRGERSPYREPRVATGDFWRQMLTHSSEITVVSAGSAASKAGGRRMPKVQSGEAVSSAPDPFSLSNPATALDFDVRVSVSSL